MTTNILQAVILLLGISFANATRLSSFINCHKSAPLTCNVQPASGSRVTGTVDFFAVKRQGGCRVLVVARVNGLSDGLHGFHVHTYGDLSSPDAVSAGPHFPNPNFTPVDHGLENDAVRHWGDLGNLVSRNGVAIYRREDDVFTLQSILGRAIIIHAMEDMGADFQPTGASGIRIGACVIGFKNKE